MMVRILSEIIGVPAFLLVRDRWNWVVPRALQPCSAFAHVQYQCYPSVVLYYVNASDPFVPDREFHWKELERTFPNKDGNRFFCSEAGSHRDTDRLQRLQRRDAKKVIENNNVGRVAIPSVECSFAFDRVQCICLPVVAFYNLRQLHMRNLRNNHRHSNERAPLGALLYPGRYNTLCDT